jgi:hypothetical protein
VDDVQPGGVERRVGRPQQERAEDEQRQGHCDRGRRDRGREHRGQREQADRGDQDAGPDVAVAQQPVGETAAGVHPGQRAAADDDDQGGGGGLADPVMPGGEGDRERPEAGARLPRSAAR